MGEAKRRKQTDPTYGRSKRGLVISPPMRINGTSLHLTSSNLDAQELRSNLLLWDKLVWPDSNLISFGTNQDEKFLEKCGVLDRPRIKLGGSGDFAQGVALAQITAFMSLDSREPGVWSLSQGESSFLLKGQRMDPESGFRVELLRAIPIPDKDIPLNEILEFKTRRHDEIYALRTEIESFVAEIKASEDKEDTLRDRINRIDIACASVLKICGEWRFPVRLSNIKASFDFKPISTLAGAFGAGAAAQTLSASASYMSAALAGGLLASAPAVKIGGDFGWKGLKARDNPYRYVVQFHRELF